MMGSDEVVMGSLSAVSSISGVMSSGVSAAGDSSPAGPQAITSSIIIMNNVAREERCLFTMSDSIAGKSCSKTGCNRRVSDP